MRALTDVMQEKKGSEHTSLQLSREGHLKVTLCQYAQEVICIEIPNHLVNLNFFYLFLAQEIKKLCHIPLIFIFLFFMLYHFGQKELKKIKFTG